MARSTSMRALIVALAVLGLANLAMAQVGSPRAAPTKVAKCSAFQSTAQIRTRVNGTELEDLGYDATDAPNGEFDGPRLEYLGDRTAFSSGDFCADPEDNPIFEGIGRSDYKELRIGSLDESRTAGGDFFFKAYDKQDQPTDCIIKLSITDGKATMTPESQCASALPDLQIVQAADKDLPNANATANPTPINSFSVFFTTDPAGDAPVPTPAPGKAPIAPALAPARGPSPAVLPVVPVAAGPKPAPAPGVLPTKPEVVPPVVVAATPEPAPSAAVATKLATAAAVVVAAALL